MQIDNESIISKAESLWNNYGVVPMFFFHGLFWLEKVNART